MCLFPALVFAKPLTQAESLNTISNILYAMKNSSYTVTSSSDDYITVGSDCGKGIETYRDTTLMLGARGDYNHVLMVADWQNHSLTGVYLDDGQPRFEFYSVETNSTEEVYSNFDLLIYTDASEKTVQKIEVKYTDFTRKNIGTISSQNFIYLKSGFADYVCTSNVPVVK